MTSSTARPRLTVAVRRTLVADHLRDHPGDSIAFLADYLGVSTRTILTDIIAMPRLHKHVGGIATPAYAAPADPCGNVVPLTGRRR